MELFFDEIFKHSDILNPISSTTLLLAGKLAQLGPKKRVLDLGSGKGFPSLLWASTFGVQVEGFDINKNFVEYANSRAKMLNLSDLVKYYCGDVKELRLTNKYDVIASLGLDITNVYGDKSDAFKTFKTMLHKHGIVIFAEPVWLVKPISSRVLKALSVFEDNFLTKFEMQQLMQKSNLQEIGNFTSTKEDWELYVKPTNIALKGVVEGNGKLAEEAKRVIDGFEAEYDAVGQHWDMVLWVAKVLSN